MENYGTATSTSTGTTSCYRQYNASGSNTSDTCGSYYTNLSQTGVNYAGNDCSITYSPDGSPSGCSGASNLGSPIGTYYTDYRYIINNFFFLNTQSKTYKGTVTSESHPDLLKNVGIYDYSLGNGVYWLCFCGDGNLNVTFSPKTSYLSYYDTSNTLCSMGYKKSGTMTISPETHKYELLSNGEYRITLVLDRVTISGLQVAQGDIQFICKYDKVPLPGRSRYLDYSKNPMVANQTSVSNNFSSSWTYNSGNGYWSNLNASEDTEVGLYVNNIPGDYTAMVYGSELYDALRYHMGGATSDSDYGKYTLFKTTGLNKVFVDWKNRPSSVESLGYMWSKYNNSTPGSLYLIMGTMTLPINSVLFYGASETADYHYQWQSNKGSILTYSAIDAAKEATKSACAKLKSDWLNLRVYVIKYKKQESSNLDYSYLNDCATRTSSPYMYDISTQDELNNALSDIYANIKTWAGRTEAKNVVN